ncbi:MAG: 3-dehydroquinate dehydratase [Epsilonproteobacteria bacterium]|nr:MAG: 3-dehydroquinate dehydratase [Campylobacterota bacterium]
MLDDLFIKSKQFVTNNNLKYQRYFIKKEALEHRLSIILGARGIGKTTTIAQYMSRYTQDEALYLSLDDISNGKQNIYEIAEAFELQGGRLLCLDEIHKYDNWSQELKSIYDNFPTLKVIASGSSALEIHKGSHDLSRRAIVYTMLGMSFREFLELHYGYSLDAYTLEELTENHEKIATKIVAKIKKEKYKIITLFRDYMKFGYYPYYLGMSNETFFFQTLKQNINVSIESDLLNIYPSLNGRSIKKIKLLLAVIMQNVPFTPNMTSLKKSIDVKDDRTIKEYLAHLDDAGLIKLLMKSSLAMKNIDKPEKIYLANTNLMYTSIPNIGNVRESFFMNQLTNYYVSKKSLGSKGIYAAQKGDFYLEEKYLVEVGGKNKTFNQIKDLPFSFLACDDMEVGHGSKIPLWLFGFLY